MATAREYAKLNFVTCCLIEISSFQRNSLPLYVHEQSGFLTGDTDWNSGMFTCNDANILGEFVKFLLIILSTSSWNLRFLIYRLYTHYKRMNIRCDVYLLFHENEYTFYILCWLFSFQLGLYACDRASIWGGEVSSCVRFFRSISFWLIKRKIIGDKLISTHVLVTR